MKLRILTPTEVVLEQDAVQCMCHRTQSRCDWPGGFKIELGQVVEQTVQVVR